MTRGDAVHVQLAVAKMRGDIRLYRPQSRRAHASLFCDPLIVPSGAEAQGDEIDECATTTAGQSSGRVRACPMSIARR